MKFRNITILLFTLFFLFTSLSATSTTKKVYESYKDFLNGEFDGLLLNEDGYLALSYKISSIPAPQENLFFSSTTDNNGNIYIGTGHKGSVYKIADKKIQKIYTTDRPDIFTITSDSNNNIYFASSPNGKIYKLDKSGKVKEFFDSKDRFYWDMIAKYDKLYVATGGNQGKLYIINTTTGSLVKDYAIEELNISKLFIQNNEVYFGGSEKGTIYKLENDKIKSIFQSGNKEIKGIFKNAENEIFLATGGSKRNNPNNKSNKIIIQNDKLSGKIIEIDKDGESEILWESDEEMPFDLKGNNNRILWCTGNKGRIYSYENNKVKLLGEVEGKTILHLHKDKDRFIGTHNFPAGIFSISDNLVLSGNYESEIIDTKSLSIFGSLYITGKGSIYGSYRGGNTGEPDNSWSEWSPLQKDKFKINLDKKRYFQFKINIKNEITDSFLKSIEFFYLPANKSPKIKTLTISDKPEKKQKEKEKTEKGYLYIKYKVEDPDNDNLLYTIYLKNTDSDRLTLLENNYENDELKIEKANFEEGNYQIKLIASDELSNPENIRKSTQKISNFFVIDYTPPTIKIINDSSFSVSDSMSNIKQVYYHTGDRKWKILFPDDKIMDSKNESFTINEKIVKMLVVKAIDSNGNKRVKIVK